MNALNLTSLPSHFHVQPPARLPCVTLSSSLVISGPGDSICPSEVSGNVEWACESSPVCVPMGAPVVFLSGAMGSCWSDRCWSMSCPVPPFLRPKEEMPSRRVLWAEGNHWCLFSKLGFLPPFSEMSSVYGGNSLLEFARICTIKLIKSLKKHSNSTKVSCCTASFPEEAVCIFKSVCKSFKSVLLQPQRVLQCCQKNCKEEIVNPWYSA